MQNLFSQIAWCAIVCGVKIKTFISLLRRRERMGGGIHHHKYTAQRCMQLEFMQQKNMKNEKSAIKIDSCFYSKITRTSNHSTTTFCFCAHTFTPSRLCVFCSHPQEARKPSMNFFFLFNLFSLCMCFFSVLSLLYCYSQHRPLLLMMMTMMLLQVLTFIQPRKRKLFYKCCPLNVVIERRRNKLEMLIEASVDCYFCKLYRVICKLFGQCKSWTFLVQKIGQDW